MRKIIKKFYLLLGPIVFFWIIRDINFIQLKEVVKNTHLIPYLMAAFMWLPIVFLKSYRWKKIMDTQKIYYSIKEAFLIYGSSSLLGLITPGKIGDFSKIAYLKKDNYSLGRAFLGSFLERVFDLLFVIIFSFIAFFSFPVFLNFNIDYYSLSKLMGLMTIILLFLFAVFYFLKKELLFNFILEILKDIRQFKTKSIFLVFSLSIIIWFFYFSLIYFIAASIDLNQSINFLYLSFASAVALLAGFLPVTVLGVGARETVFIFLMAPLGINKETVVIFSLLILVNYLALFVVNFYCWIKKPLISLNSSEKTSPKKFPA